MHICWNYNTKHTCLWSRECHTKIFKTHKTDNYVYADWKTHKTLWWETKSSSCACCQTVDRLIQIFIALSSSLTLFNIILVGNCVTQYIGVPAVSGNTEHSVGRSVNKSEDRKNMFTASSLYRMQNETAKIIQKISQTPSSYIYNDRWRPRQTA